MSNPLRRTYAAPSKATPSTLCQKCLKRGHYSYECTAKSQDRPYISRPSRTQQLLNPNLKPKLASDEPNPFLQKEGTADEQLRRINEERGRKRRRLDGDDGSARSASSSSSDSVSTISTNGSRSPNPQTRQRASSKPERGGASHKASESRSAPKAAGKHPRDRHSQSASSSDDPPRAQNRTSRRHSNHARLASASPTRDPRTRQAASPLKPSRHRQRTRSRSLDKSGEARRRRSLSATERHHQSRHSGSRDEEVVREGYSRTGKAAPGLGRRSQQAPRERSLSPYSKRLALTQAMNMAR